MEVSRKKLVVLAADDDENAHILLRRAFAKSGVSAIVQSVSNGQEVVCYLRGDGKYSIRSEHPLPDIVLLDLKMPCLSGFEVLQLVKKDPRFDGLKMYVLSSSNNPADIQKARELGCDGYFVKPNRFDQLVELVSNLDTELPSAPVTKKAPGKPSSSSTKLAKQKATESGPMQKTKESAVAMLVEQVRDYAIFVLDPNGRIQSWNEGARRLKGYDDHEIIGKHFSIFYTPADLESEKPQFELRIAADTGRYEDEGWRVRKDGSRFWANVIITALRDNDGTLVGFGKVTRDLTQRKLQEEGLQRLLESEERFRLLVEQVKDYAIFILDARGNVVSWNQGAKRIKGYSADEIIGKHFSIFHTPEDIERDHPGQELLRAVQEGRFEEEGWRVRKDGTRIWANVVITSIWDKRGNLAGFAKVTRDLTARKMEEEALRQRTRDLESFAHTLSHDLRAPLRSISSFSQILQVEGEEVSEAERREYAGKIVKAAASMETLIEDILKYSQMTLTTITVEDV
jgi:PAS domain S-box-containing protein